MVARLRWAGAHNYCYTQSVHRCDAVFLGLVTFSMCTAGVNSAYERREIRLHSSQSFNWETETSGMYTHQSTKSCFKRQNAPNPVCIPCEWGDILLRVFVSWIWVRICWRKRQHIEWHKVVINANSNQLIVISVTRWICWLNLYILLTNCDIGLGRSLLFEWSEVRHPLCDFSRRKLSKLTVHTVTPVLWLERESS